MLFTRLASFQARDGLWPKPKSSGRLGQTQNHDALTSSTSEETATTSRSSGISKFEVSTTEDGPTSALAIPMSTPTNPSSSRNASTQLPGFIGLSAATSRSLSTGLSVSSSGSSTGAVEMPTGAASTGANEPAPSQKELDGLSHGATAAIVVGILLVLAAFLYAIWIAIQNKKNDRRTRSPTFPSYDVDLPLRDLARTDEYRHTGVRFGGGSLSEQFAPETGMPSHLRDGTAGYGGLNGEPAPRYPANAYWGQSVAWG
ncbi:hypothetical protein TOPH_06049 [Tolypocladium ophioglossoides CBS 100239]|uniref:Uncharacterized protein n=1 Tax=Tolypocladium ophioglossoides (strain CBS 100239) TaxID=1163406 RepID=A0A0L0N646_TOLOC|nr:hypothetical protein TOPH_06049 [Tolypocladium ophioglossoides CBS 100239]